MENSQTVVVGNTVVDRSILTWMPVAQTLFDGVLDGHGVVITPHVVQYDDSAPDSGTLVRLIRKHQDGAAVCEQEIFTHADPLVFESLCVTIARERGYRIVEGHGKLFLFDDRAPASQQVAAVA